jgi:hypothetical protein
MKKKTAILIGVIVVLGTLIWISKRPDSDGTRKEYDYTFHIEDTASIGRIVLRDKKPREVTLVRTENGWMVNGDHLARKRATAILMKTFYKMRLKNFIAENMQQTVLSRLASTAVEVEVYDRSGKKLRHFYVGPPTMDEMGSYMMNKGGDAPYAVFIPGFNGNLSTRFFADPMMWYDRTIWGYDNLEIKKVRVRYANTPVNSFEIEKHRDGDYSLTRLIDEEVFTPDSIQSALFFAAFRNLQYEGAIVKSDPIYAKQDSLKAGKPVFDIYVEHESGEWKTLTAYHIKAAEGTEDADGNPRKYDPDRVHAFIETSEGKEMFVLAQYYGLQLALVDIPTLVKNF